jgi:hypothetical protein
MSHEDYLSALYNHYQTCFPLSSVMVTGASHTINGPNKHVHYEQLLNIFGGTRGTDVYIIGRGYNTVFTQLGDGGYGNWHFGGHFIRNDKTVTFT